MLIMSRKSGQKTRFIAMPSDMAAKVEALPHLDLGLDIWIEDLPSVAS
jgi:hypothetical protein